MHADFNVTIAKNFKPKQADAKENKVLKMSNKVLRRRPTLVAYCINFLFKVTYIILEIRDLNGLDVRKFVLH